MNKSLFTIAIFNLEQEISKKSLVFVITACLCLSLLLMPCMVFAIYIPDGDGLNDTYERCTGKYSHSNDTGTCTYYTCGSDADTIRPGSALCQSPSDYDGDGLLDDLEASTSSTSPVNADTDGDGGLPLNPQFNDKNDSCPNGATGWTSNSVTDRDGDGCRDMDEDDCVDPDRDNYGSSPFKKTGCTGTTGPQPANDVFDNCPLIHNPWQTDSDGDGTGDVCETTAPDTDNDGVADSADSCKTGVTDWTSDAGTDIDGDGCKDDDPEDTCVDPEGDNFGSSPFKITGCTGTATACSKSIELRANEKFDICPNDFNPGQKNICGAVLPPCPPLPPTNVNATNVN